MGFDVAASTSAAAPPETVWALLGEPKTWTTWWTDCEAAHSNDHRALREGSQLEVVLRFGSRTITQNPVVDLLTEARTLSLTSRGGLLQSTVVWDLQPGGRGTRIGMRGDFAGLATAWFRLSGQVPRVHGVLNSMLRGLKRGAERLA